MTDKTVMETALSLLDKRNYSRKKLAAALRDAGFNEDEVDDCVERIYAWGYLNDKQLGVERIKKLQAKLKSRLYIETVLREDGLELQMIGELLDKMYPVEMEVEIAGKLLARKFASQRTSARKQREYLLRSGFADNTVGQCLVDVSTT